MVTLCYSGKSRITAEAIAAASNSEIRLNRGPTGNINWGRATAATILNPDIGNSTNKREMRILFAENDVPAPRLFTADEARHAAIGGDVDFIGRPDHHMKGRGYWKVSNMASLNRALRGTRRKAAATHFIEYIPDATEIRVHIFRGKSLRISEKQFEGREGCHRLYTTIKPTQDRDTLKKARRAAKKAVAAIGLDFGAVDILIGADNEVYVLEVNAAPGLGGSLPRVYAEKIVQYFTEEA